MDNKAILDSLEESADKTLESFSTGSAFSNTAGYSSGFDTARMLVDMDNSWYTEPKSYYYPFYNYCHHLYRDDSFEKSFKVVSYLMEKKLVKMDSIKEFVKLVDDLKSLI